MGWYICTKELAGKPCDICGKDVKEDDRIYLMLANVINHALCVEKQEEQRQKDMRRRS